ncbi:hypothetical protein ABMA28_003751 [Loxostege sticticalis]|uniref:Reverse transcriptase n=1 Tax=Loxostege sticticalis TaxID=481309 RepID=A0ABD0STH8_LOXSC
MGDSPVLQTPRSRLAEPRSRREERSRSRHAGPGSQRDVRSRSRLAEPRSRREERSRSRHAGPGSQRDARSRSRLAEPRSQRDERSPSHHDGPGSQRDVRSRSRLAEPRSRREERSRSRHAGPGSQRDVRSRSRLAEPRSRREERSRSRHAGPGSQRDVRSRSRLAEPRSRREERSRSRHAGPGSQRDVRSRSRLAEPRSRRDQRSRSRQAGPGSHRDTRSRSHHNEPRSQRNKLPDVPSCSEHKERSQDNSSNKDPSESIARTYSLDSIAQIVQVLKSINQTDSLDKLGSMQNTVPEFDPNRKEQTMTMWLHKVNECASIYGWTEKQIIHFALPKLRGVAQRWYEGLSSVLHSWDEWQRKLLSAFPSEENYGQMLSDMLAKRARFGDSLEEYYYDKIGLINRCGIVGTRAVECILHGIDDRSVRLGAEAVKFDDPDKLLSYLRNVRHVKSTNDRRPSKPSLSKNQDTQFRSQSKPSRCLNCRQEGHVFAQCPTPLKKCGKCGKIGHKTEQCFSKRPMPDKVVLRVASNKTDITSNDLIHPDANEKYFKLALVNGMSMPAFIDFGSECSMIKLSEFQKISTDFDKSNLPVLRGFGNSMVRPLGSFKVQVELDGVAAKLDLIIVPDEVMQVPLMIGQTFTEQPHIVIRKTSDSLEISSLEIPENHINKIKLFCKSQVLVSGLTIIDVYTEDSNFEGELFIEGSLRRLKDIPFSISSGLFYILRGHGQIVASCSPSSTVTLKQDSLIARGQVAQEDVANQILDVMKVSSQNTCPITISDLNIDHDLSDVEKQQLLDLLNNYRDCFAFDLSELGSTSAGEMKIILQDDLPVVYRPYRLAIKEKEKVREMVTELLDNDIIRPSTSPYASPIVLVRKKSGDIRMCIDYRALNKKTVKEKYPMPLIDDQIDTLAGNSFFTTLDLASGYYQVPIREDDKHKTAFVTPEGHYEFNRMPFGLANAPATFQRLMNQILGNARHGEALAYLDDVIIPSKSISEGMDRLQLVLQLFKDAGLSLKPSKCFFFKRTVDFLGFEISESGIRPGGSKIEAIEKYPTPQNQHNIRQFLGLASFFRRFVPKFSIIAKPLTNLLKKNIPWVWGADQEQAFKSLKDELVQKPTLALYNPEAETELHTDASKVGVAGILLQRDGNALRPIAYFSKQTTPEEQNYSSYDLETLAVVSALQKFRVYLIGVPFKIVTDCNALKATFQKRDMLPRVARWWEQMQEFNFVIEYKPGTSMSHVDALSRNPLPNPSDLNVLSVSECNWLTTVQSADDTIQRIRYNKIVVDALTAKTIGTAENKWDDHLPEVQWGINNTFNKGINRSPAEALFGKRLTGLSEGRIISELGDDITRVNNNQNLDEIRAEISAHVEARQEIDRERFNKKRSKPMKYQVGDLVRVERQVPSSGQSRKLVPKFQGPYRIVNVLGNDRYQIEDTPITKKGNRHYSTVVAVDKIRSCSPHSAFKYRCCTSKRSLFCRSPKCSDVQLLCCRNCREYCYYV